MQQVQDGRISLGRIRPCLSHCTTAFSRCREPNSTHKLSCRNDVVSLARRRGQHRPGNSLSIDRCSQQTTPTNRVYRQLVWVYAIQDGSREEWFGTGLPSSLPAVSFQMTRETTVEHNQRYTSALRNVSKHRLLSKTGCTNS